MKEIRLVSVVIPTFNRSKLCKEAVESALGQSYPHLEVIVVDDGSVDDTRTVISGLDQRVRYVWQKNSGVSAARNKGMSVAQGEFIAFLDSDDKWLPWKLESQLEVLDCFPTAGMVWTDMIAIDEHGNTLHDSYLEKMYDAYRYFDRDTNFHSKRTLGDIWKDCPERFTNRICCTGYIFPWMFMGNLVHTSTVLLRRDLQRKVGEFDITLEKSGEDYDFHLRTCRLGDVAYIDASSVLCRIGAADQLTSPEYMFWLARNNLKTVERIDTNNKMMERLPKELIRKRMAQSFSWVGFSEFYTDRKSSRKHLRKSLSFDLLQIRIILYYFLSFFPTETIKFLTNTINKVRFRKKIQ